jgi:hypothetical protein
VADADVVPVHHIERAVGGELEVDRSEVAVAAGDQVVAELGLVELPKLGQS